jgi:7,8-dihydropterin-6-yl-methyl-4-(beta-D-ribofuranosyl)aminobenzene 5'-phosphate synthase
MARLIISRIAVITALAAVIGASAANAQSNTGQITVLYDAFGKTSTMTKDWGFAALVEYGGKRILFDAGNNAEIFAHNVEAKGIDLKQLDFAVVSHRHGDHTSGLNHLLKVNPQVKIYAPQENFGVFGGVLPSTFYRRNDSLPTDMRYFDGKPPDTLQSGTPWPEGNFSWIAKNDRGRPRISSHPAERHLGRRFGSERNFAGDRYACWNCSDCRLQPPNDRKDRRSC